MNITMEQVLNILSPDEPNYQEAAAKLGPAALPHLEDLIKSEDSLLASKATYLTSLIDDDRTISILNKASKSKYPEVRIATANGIKNIITKTNIVKSESSIDREREKLIVNLLNDLKGDSDVGVQKSASKTLKSLESN
jgi:HEAT repeat protein